MSVKYYTASMTGAPIVSNNWGDLTNALDALLVNGFNLKTIDSLTSAANVATASVSAGHGYIVGQIILIAGCDQAAYNGEQRVLSITSSTFTFAVVGTPASPATSSATITAKVAPLGFEIAFTGTNKRAYRSPNVQSNRPYLRVDNERDPVYTTTYAKYAKVTMAEGMSDIDTFVGARAPFDPALQNKNEMGTGSGTSAYGGWFKWWYARQTGASASTGDGGSGARNWVLIGDNRGFYLAMPHQTNATVRAIYSFGDFASYKVSDGYSSLLTASDDYSLAQSGNASYPANSLDFEKCQSTVGKVLMRNFTQAGNPVNAKFFSITPTLNASYVSGAGNAPWPNGADFGLHLYPVWLQESSDQIRGQTAGLFFTAQQLPYSDLTIVENVTGYEGRRFLLINGARDSAQNNQDSTRVAFDITGPWRS